MNETGFYFFYSIRACVCRVVFRGNAWGIARIAGGRKPHNRCFRNGFEKNKITVKEKWTIFPLPFFGINSSGWAVGGAFMDTNAFGIKDNMMVMGSYGSNSWMASVMYIHSSHAVGDFGWNLMGMFSSQDKENTDQRDELTLRRYNSVTINPAFGLSYKLTDLITPSINVGYKNVMLRDTDSPVNAPKEGVQAIRDCSH